MSSALMYQPMAKDWTIRKQKEQIARAKLAPVRSEMYIPQGVTVLKESEGFHPPDYFGGFGCFGISVKIIYGTNRPIDEIREEYAHELTEANWNLDSGYKPVEDYMVYKKGDEYQVVIDTLEDFTAPIEQDFEVIYSVILRYWTPSYDKCTG